MKIEVEIEEGDIIKFNDEVWEIIEYHPHNNTFDMRSAMANLENFTEEEIEKMIDMTGKFTYIKESYIGVS